MDDVDGFECRCEEGYTGDHCQCAVLEADSEYEEVCVDVNTTLSWTIPPDYLPDYTDTGDLETTTQGEQEVIHVADVEVTVGYEDITPITATVEDIEPTPSFPMASTDMMGEKNFLS